LAGAVVQREFTSPASGARTVVWQQQLDNIPLFEALLTSHETRQAELISINSGFIPNPAAAADAEIPNRAAIIAAPPVSAAGAIVRAAENIGDKLVEPAVRSLGPPDGGVQKFSAGRLPG